MAEYDEKTYGALWAEYYDGVYQDVDESTVEFLTGFAGSPPRMLELAIGTGRVALPVARNGVAVTGVDISEEMVAKLEGKPGGEAIAVVIGDFADVPVEGTFPLIFLGFNTLFALLTQERQVECFENVADRLESGGRFVLDTFVPDMTRWDSNHSHMGVSSITSNVEHAYEVSIHDPVTQTVNTHSVRRQASGESVILPVRVRYAWPSEMDLMARLAGLELEDRWGWYDRRPFTGASGQNVSVYRKP